MAARCSPIGLSSDSLGSVRIPAAFCGLYGFKPTAGRLTIKGIANLNPYQVTKRILIRSVFGPVGRSVDDIVLFTKYLFEKYNNEHDPSIPYAPLNTSKLNLSSNLKIGLWKFQELFPPSRTSKNAVDRAAQVFEDKGHEIIPFDWPNYS